MIDFLLNVFSNNVEKEAMFFGGQSFKYSWLLARINRFRAEITERELPSGAVVAIEGDFSPNTVAFMLFLVGNRNIIIPISPAVGKKRDEFFEIGKVQYSVHFEGENYVIRKLELGTLHPIYIDLQNRRNPGLVLFSSGSTGQSKAAVHDFSLLLKKFEVSRQQKRILAFLLFDHIGGLNTLLYTLSNGGCLVAVTDRSPEGVAALIQEQKVQILPTTPTFLNLLILSGVLDRYDLSSLELVTYGTEVMTAGTLERINKALPNVRFQQTYGLSEIGILRSKSEANNSLWVRIGGEGFSTRVVEGLLEIKAESAMIGYLNAPSPFTSDGWFKTGDAVEVKGEYLKILGRQSEIINVGGEKVYPAEVESLIMSLHGVEDAVVTSEKNPIVGNIIVAKVKLATSESSLEFKKRLRTELMNKCEPFKIPQKIIVCEGEFHGARFKKDRKINSLGAL